MNTVHFMSEKMDWATPQELFDRLNQEFYFTLDVCALPENAKCKRYFSPKEDGLQQKWTGVCWMNPPYGREIEQWMQKALQESERGATVVCLVPARTDTEWWHKYALHGEIRFIRGRVKFQGANATAPFPSAIVIFRDQWWKRRWMQIQ
jgi:phage N-6-adenine-methyltransferase